MSSRIAAEAMAAAADLTALVQVGAKLPPAARVGRRQPVCGDAAAARPGGCEQPTVARSTRPGAAAFLQVIQRS
jgi:hypothetical protein